MKNHVLKAAAVILAAVIGLGAFTGCLQVNGDRVALTLDGEQYSRGEALLYFHFNQYDTEYNLYSLADTLYGGLMNYWAYTNESYTPLVSLRENSMQMMIQTKILNKQAAKDGITLTEDEETLLTRTVNRYLRDYPTVVAAAEASKEEITQFIRENMIANKEYMYITNGIDTSYDENDMIRKTVEGIVINTKYVDDEPLPDEEQQELIQKYLIEVTELMNEGRSTEDIVELYSENTEVGLMAVGSQAIAKSQTTEGWTEGDEPQSYYDLAWPLSKGEVKNCMIQNTAGNEVGYIARCTNDNDEEAKQEAINSEMMSRRKERFKTVYEELKAGYKKIHVYTEVVNDFVISATLYDGSEYEESMGGTEDEITVVD